MWMNGAIAGVGCVLTALTYNAAQGGGTYIILWGAILFGGWRFWQATNLRNKAPELADQFVASLSQERSPLGGGRREFAVGAPSVATEDRGALAVGAETSSSSSSASGSFLTHMRAIAARTRPRELAEFEAEHLHNTGSATGLTPLEMGALRTSYARGLYELAKAGDPDAYAALWASVSPTVSPPTDAKREGVHDLLKTILD